MVKLSLHLIATIIHTLTVLNLSDWWRINLFFFFFTIRTVLTGLAISRAKKSERRDCQIVRWIAESTRETDARRYIVHILLPSHSGPFYAERESRSSATWKCENIRYGHVRVVVAINIIQPRPCTQRQQEATALQAFSIGKYFLHSNLWKEKEFIIAVTLDMHYSIFREANLHRQIFRGDPVHHAIHS